MSWSPFRLLLIPFGVALLTQTIKFFVRFSQTRKLDFGVFNQYGGMPSGHTAFVISLCTVVGLSEGVTSAAFAVSIVLALLTIRDAVSFRQTLSRYGEVLNRLVQAHPEQNIRIQFPEKIEERLGHTPLQAAVGGLIGVLVSSLFYLLLS